LKISKIEPIKEEKKKLRVAAYCRVSTSTSEQEESFEAQKNHYEAYIKSNPAWEFAGIFYDFGISGTSTAKREGLFTLIDQCKRGKIDYILTKSISRFSRNTTDCLTLVRELLALNIPVYFEKENIDTESMENELILTILSSMAESESSSTSRNIKWSVQKRFQNGTFTPSCAAFGYKIDENGNYVINEDEAKIVRLIFNLFLSGYGSEKIAKELNQKSIPSKKNQKWTSGTVLAIIKNEKYAGDLILQKTYSDRSYKRHINHGEYDKYLISNDHEPIISREDYEKAKKIIEINRNEKKIQTGNQYYLQKYLFTSRIQCGECGAIFRRKRYISRKDDCIWLCYNHIQDKQSCSMKSVFDSSIKSAFVTMLNKLIFSRNILLRNFYRDFRNDSSKENLSEVITLQKELKNNLEKRDILRSLRAQEIINNVIYTSEQNSLLKKYDEIKKEIEFIENSYSIDLVHNNEIEKLLNFTERSDYLDYFDPELFTAFTDKIIITQRNRITFILKCGLQLQEELE